MKEPHQFQSRINIILKAILFCFVFTGLFIVFTFFKSFIPEKFERVAHGIIGTTVALLTTFVFLKIDKKSFAAIGLIFDRNTLKKFFFGVLAGIALMGLLSVSVICFSDFKIEMNDNSSVLNFFLWTLPLIPLAFLEEVGFRAYPLIILKDRIGIRKTVIITSFLFAFYHITNGWSVQNAFLGAGVW